MGFDNTCSHQTDQSCGALFSRRSHAQQIRSVFVVFQRLASSERFEAPDVSQSRSVHAYILSYIVE